MSCKVMEDGFIHTKQKSLNSNHQTNGLTNPCTENTTDRKISADDATLFYLGKKKVQSANETKPPAATRWLP